MKKVKICILLGLCVFTMSACTFSGGSQSGKKEKKVIPKTSVIADKEASTVGEPKVDDAYKDYENVRISTMAKVRFYVEKNPEGVYTVIAAQPLDDYGSKVLATYEPTGMLYDEAVTMFIEQSLAKGYASDINCRVTITASPANTTLESTASKVAEEQYRLHGIEAVVVTGAEL